MLSSLAMSSIVPCPAMCSKMTLKLIPGGEGLRHLELLDELHGGEAGGARAGAEAGLQALQLARPRAACAPG